MNPKPLPWLVKVGGAELSPGDGLRRLADTIGRAVRAGVPTVLVHGGGEEITQRADALGLPTTRVAGHRVTDPAMLEVVVEVLAGRINVRLVQALHRAGVPAVGLTGGSARLLSVVPAGQPPGALGAVGRPTLARTRLLHTLLDEGLTPVVAPLGIGEDGSIFNVNADSAAGALAASLGASLSLLTDVPAVLDEAGRPIATLRPARLRALLHSGVARGGMIPKLEAAEAALEGGAASVWIGSLDGLVPPGVPPGTGTTVLRRRSVPPGLLTLLPTIGGTKR